MLRNLAVLFALAVILAIPFLLKPKTDLLAKADEILVIISPHNEAIRYEFSRAFGEYYKTKTGKAVRIDWRNVGGTTEITRFIASEFNAAFAADWIRSGRQWSDELQADYVNGKIVPDGTPQDDTAAEQVRRTFLSSNVGIGIDLFFGGGSFDYSREAAAGRLVDCGVVAAHPEWFGPNAIPQNLGGEPLWDPSGRWIGTCLAAFGICYNTDSLRRLHIGTAPAHWEDLGNPRLIGEVALADPTKSGSVAKAFEMLIQEQMQVLAKQSGVDISAKTDPQIVAGGWANGMRLLQKLAGNARYFTDSASKVTADVSIGDSAAGMCIDFYGRFQAESVTEADGTSRMLYVSPIGGTSNGADPIGLLRGAPSPELAREFIRFVLSLEGQKLWNFKIGAPGGPVKFALRRLPIRPELYAPEYARYMADAGVNPYKDAEAFVYQPAWTGGLFAQIRLIVRVMCIDPHEELKEAWRELAAANFPAEAMGVFSDVSAVSYENANAEIRSRMKTKIEEVRLAKDLSEHFRAQYRQAAKLAREGGK